MDCERCGKSFESVRGAGVAKRFDQHFLVHSIWKRLAELGTAVWVERVPMAGVLSGTWCPRYREEYSLLEEMGAIRRSAHVDVVFHASLTNTRGA